MTYQELLTRIVWQAQRGGPKFEIAEMEAIAIAEAIFPTISDAVSTKCASDLRLRSLLRRTVTITMADGEGAIPDDVLTAYIGSDGTLLDRADTTKRYAYMTYDRFLTRPRTLLGLFTVLGEQRLLQREPNTLYVLGEGFSDDMDLNTPCTVVRPAAATDEVEVVPEVNDMLINVGAEMLRGELASRAVNA